MRVNERMKKVFSILLCLCMVLQYVPTTAFAATTAEGGLCEHHTEHTAECGYAEAVEGQPCTHVHDELCGYAEAVAEVLCACEATDENGALVHTEGCGYVAPVTGEDCAHVHDDSCGYVSAVEGHDCHYECAECADSNVIANQSADWCGNPLCSQEDAFHVTSCTQYVAPENPQCFCAAKCTEANVWCDVCGFDYSKCTGTDRAVGYGTGWELDVTTLIVTDTLTALPEGVEYSDIKVEEGGNLALGKAEVYYPVDVMYGGTISSGIYWKSVHNSVTISGGTFYSDVVNDGTISGGTFIGAVTNNGTIANVTFSFAKVSNSEYGTIRNAKFETRASLESGSKDPESVIHCINGKDITLIYNAELPAALGTGAVAWYQGSTQVTGGTVPLNYTEYVGEYKITAVDATNGTVSVPATAKYGQTVTITTTPANGYLLEKLTVMNGDTEVEVSSNTFTMPAGAVTVSATFTLCDHSESTHETATDVGEGKHSFTCTVCGSTGSAAHTGGTATCTTLAVCDTCGESYGEADLSAHAFADDNATCKYCRQTIVAKVTRDGVVSYYTDINDVARAEEGSGAVLTVLRNITLTESKALGYMTLEREGDVTITVPDGCYLSVNSNSAVTWIDCVGYLAVQKPGGLEISYRTFEKVSGNPYFLLRDHTVANTSVEKGYLNIAEGATLTVTGTMDVSADSGQILVYGKLVLGQNAAATNAGEIRVNGTLELGANATVTNSGAILLNNPDAYKTGHDIPTGITGGTVEIDDVTYTYVSGGSTDEKDTLPHWTCSDHTGLIGATCITKAHCVNCGDEYEKYGNHSINTTTGKCVHCGEDVAVATVSDGTTTLYAAGEQQLKELTGQLLNSGSRTITAVISEGYMLDSICTAVRNAVPDESQTVHLTVKGVTAISGDSGLQGLTQLASLSLPDVTYLYQFALKDTHLQKLELTAEGEITLERDVIDSSYVGSVDLVLCCNKASSVTGGVTWQNTTFGSVTYTEHDYESGICTVCDEVCDHSKDITATDNGNGTHKKTCNACGHVEERESHTYTLTAAGNVITSACKANCGNIGTATITAAGKTYDGHTAEAKVTTEGNLANATLRINYAVKGGASLGSAPVNAGTYTASIGMGEHENAVLASVEFIIEKANPVIVAAPTPNTLTYSGEAQNLISQGEADLGTMVYSLTEDGDYTTTIPKGTNAGDYKVWYYVQGDANHNDSAKDSVSVTIAKADPVIGTVGCEMPLFDTTAASAVELKRTVMSVDGTLVLTDSELTAGEGTYNWKFTPKDTDNYNTITGTVVLNVTADVLEKIEASGNLEKDSYSYGDTFSIDGLTVTATYTTGATKDVTGLVSFDSTLAVGQTSVELTYQGKTCTVTGFTVAKKQLVIDRMAWDIPENAVYSGTAYNATLTGNLPEGVTVTKTGDTATNAGDYTAKAVFSLAEGYSADNYEIVNGEDLTADWTIAKKNIAGAQITLGTALTYNGKQQTQTVASVKIDGLTVTYTVSGNTGTDAKGYTLTVTGNGNFEGSATADWSIAKAKLTITANNNSITYGDVPAANGVTGTGFVSSESIEALSGKLTYSYNYEQFGNVGTYKITPSGVTSNNYEITFADGILTVNAKTITVTADAVSKTYGDADPKLTYKVEGLVNGDELTGELKRVAGENVGDYAIEQNTLTAGNNYRLTYTGAKLTINAKAITAADVKLNGSLTYNSKEQTQPITVTEGITYEVSGNKAINVGTYELTVKGTGNYTGSVTLDWTIAKAKLTITADSKVIYIGEQLSTLTYTTSGFVGGDKLTKEPVLTTNADADQAGSYTITAANADAGDNYTITYVSGSLTIMDKETEVETKIEQTKLTEVPEGLKDTQFDTVEEIKEELISKILATSTGYSAENMVHYDVALHFSLDAGDSWILATEENFSTEGITVILPYPEGTNARDYEFVVSHMFTVTSQRLGTVAGEVEMPKVEETANGIRVTLNGLSPVTVAARYHDHTGGIATCTDKAICSICGTAYGELDATNHAGGTEVKNAKEATCGAEGYTGDTHCKGCGEIVEKGAAIKATGEHTYGDWKVVKEPTKTTKGEKQRTCSVCGHVDSKEIPVLSDTPATGDDSNIILYGSMFSVSLAGLVVLLLAAKKRKQETA